MFGSSVIKQNLESPLFTNLSVGVNGYGPLQKEIDALNASMLRAQSTRQSVASQLVTEQPWPVPVQRDEGSKNILSIDPNTLRAVRKHSFAFLSMRLFDEYLIVGSTSACPVKLLFNVELLQPREEPDTSYAGNDCLTDTMDVLAARRRRGDGKYTASTCVFLFQRVWYLCRDGPITHEE